MKKVLEYIIVCSLVFAIGVGVAYCSDAIVWWKALLLIGVGFFVNYCATEIYEQM